LFEEKTMLLGNAMLVKKDYEMVKKACDIVRKIVLLRERDFVRLSSYAVVLLLTLFDPIFLCVLIIIKVLLVLTKSQSDSDRKVPGNTEHNADSAL